MTDNTEEIIYNPEMLKHVRHKKKLSLEVAAENVLSIDLLHRAEKGEVCLKMTELYGLANKYNVAVSVFYLDDTKSFDESAKRQKKVEKNIKEVINFMKEKNVSLLQLKNWLE